MATFDIVAVRTIESPRVFHPGTDDKGGYWQDFGITTAFDFDSANRSLVAVLREATGPTRLFIFDLGTGGIRFQPTISTNHRADINAVKLSPSGRIAAVPTGKDRELTLWDVDTGAVTARGSTDGDAGDVDWNPAGELLAVIADKYLEIWKFAGGVMEKQKSVKASRGATEFPMAVRWSPNGRYLAIGTNAPAVYIGNADGSRQSPSLIPQTKGAAHVTEWNPAGDRLAVAGFGAGGNITIWKDAHMALDSPFEQKYALLQTFAPPAGEWWGKLTWDPTGLLLMAGTRSRSGIWDATSGNLLESFAPHPTSTILEAHWKGDYLITVGDHPDKSFRIWRVASAMG